MKGFLVGLGLGIAAGVLFAPASGEETRRDLRERAEDAVDTGRRKWGEVLETGREKAGEIGSRAGKQTFDKVTENIRPEGQRSA